MTPHRVGHRRARAFSSPVLAIAGLVGVVLGCGGRRPESYVCPEGMLLVPAGPFRYGAKRITERQAKESIAAFCIDGYEFPCRKGASPERNVTWLEAASRCRALGKRLCTEYEWEKACRGPKGLLYPWGNQFDGFVCALDPKEAAEHRSGAKPACVSPYGVHDMAGSVWEWTENAWNGDQARRVVRGGWEEGLGDRGASCSFRASRDPGVASPRVGFRCCSTARPTRPAMPRLVP